MSSPIIEIKLNKLDDILSSIKQYCQTQQQQPNEEHNISKRKVFVSIVDDLIFVLRDFYSAFSSDSELDQEIQAPPGIIVNDSPASIRRETRLLSLHQIRVIYTAVEVLWHLVLKHFVSTNAGFELPEAHLPKSIMLSSDNLVQIAVVTSGDHGNSDGDGHGNITTRARAMRCLHVVADITMNEMFAGHMLDRNLNRILLCSLNIEHTAAVDSSSGNVSVSREGEENHPVEVSGLILSRLLKSDYCNLVVEKLRQFVKAPPWLQARASAVLTAILTNADRNGLMAVLHGYLDGVSMSSPQSITLQQQVAVLVSSAPRAAIDKVDYFRSICQQLSAAISSAMRTDDLIFLRVLVMVCSRLSRVCYSLLTRTVMQPLMASLDLRDERRVESRGKAVKLLHNFLFLLPTDAAIVLTLRKSGLVLEAMKLFVACFLASERGRARLLDAEGLARLKEFCTGYLAKERDVSAASAILELLLVTLVAVPDSPPGQEFELRTSKMGTPLPSQSPLLRSPQSLLQAIRRDEQAAGGNESGVDDDDDDEQQSMEIVRALIDKVACREQQNPSSSAGSSARFTSLLSNLPVIVQLLLATGQQDSGSGGSGRDDAGQPPKPLCCAVPSQLFLRALRCFLSSEEDTLIDGGGAGGGGGAATNEAGSSSKKPRAVNLDKQQAAFVVLSLLQAVPLDMLLLNGLSILQLLLAFLEGVADEAESDKGRLPDTPSPLPLVQVLESADEAAVVGEEGGEQESGSGLLALVLNVLTIILSTGRSDRSLEEEAVIRQMVSPLQKIALQGFESESPPSHQAAHDLAGVILHRQLTRSSNDEGCPRAEEAVEVRFQKCLRALQVNADDSVTKAFDLHSCAMVLRDMAVQRKTLTSDEVVAALRCLDPLLDVVDSFVYLNCLLCLKQLAHYCFFHNYGTDRLNASLTAFLRELLRSYSTESAQVNGRHRAMLGELLLLVLRMTRSAATHSSVRSTPLPSLLAVRPLLLPLKEICLRMARGRATRSDAALLDDPSAASRIEVDIRRSMTLTVPGGAAADDPQNQAARKGESDVARAAEVADAVLLRQSALSVLAELVVLLHSSSLPVDSSDPRDRSSHALYSLVDVLDVAGGVLKMETSRSQSATSCRRSAAFLMRYVLCYVPPDLPPGELGSLLKDVYRSMKTAAQDSDAVVRFNGEVALDHIGQIARSLLALSSDGLESHGNLLKMLRVVNAGT